MVTTVVNMATESFKRYVPYSTINRSMVFPAGLQILRDEYNEKSDSPSCHCIPVSEQWLLLEWSCWANHAVVPSSAQQRASTVQG